MNRGFSNIRAPGAKAVLFALAVLAVALIAALWMRPVAHRPANTPDETSRSEALLSELIRREGRLYAVGESNAYSGLLIERYPHGALRSRSTILDGLLHGVSEGWFTNGQLQVKENFKHGVSHGPRLKWYASGKKLSEADIVEGKLDGSYRKWHENGLLAEQVEFVQGQPAGMSLAYWPSGFLKTRATLNAGTVMDQTFWKDGESSENVANKSRLKGDPIVVPPVGRDNALGLEFEHLRGVNSAARRAGRK